MTLPLIIKVACPGGFAGVYTWETLKNEAFHPYKWRYLTLYGGQKVHCRMHNLHYIVYDGVRSGQYPD